ncbi:hypothetical protein [Asaia platycodi]|uniref:hypothetical protein n=1 Tax=Asaia platycodi TaxID=610243 RepID=UPI00046FC968|nr:hypothetical protein [Asaia platycodi]
MASLHEALLKAHLDKAQADRQDARITEQAEACTLADTKLETLRATFTPFLQRLGASEIDAIRPVLDEAARHYRDQEEKTRLETQITEHSDGLDLAQLQAQARETDPALIETRLGAVESEQTELERQRDAAFSRGGEIRRRCVRSKRTRPLSMRLSTSNPAGPKWRALPKNGHQHVSRR